MNFLLLYDALASRARIEAPVEEGPAERAELGVQAASVLLQKEVQQAQRESDPLEITYDLPSAEK